MGFLYGRTGRLTSQNGDFRPGQFDVAYADGDAGERVPRSRVRAKDTYEAGWEAQLARLKVYRAEHGDCNVSTLRAEDPQLGRWGITQQTLKKKLDRGEPCRGMTATRAAKLDALGFKWELPTKKPLGKAKDEQHIGGEPPVSGGGSAAVSEAQLAKPSAATVSQDPLRQALRQAKSRDAKVRAGDEDAWNGWLAKLTRYKTEHGDCNVPWTKDPSAYPDALTLSRTDPLSVTDGLCRVGCVSLSGGRQEVRPPIALSCSHTLTLPCSYALTR
jgi:hypothetical protein